MATSRITSDMIKPFGGEGDVVAWLQKVKLVAKLSKVTELESFLPLYLEGSALAVYLEMSSKEQEDAGKIEERLIEVFTDGQFVAYSKLVSSKWSGEAVDVFANELRRLAGLAGFKGEGLEAIVKLQFVTGFPDSMSVELQQVIGIKAMSMSSLLPRARILASTTSTASSGAVAVGGGNRKDVKPRESRQGAGFRGKCYNCDGPHMARNCPERKVITCYRCGIEGHVAAKCGSGSGNNQGNE